MFKRIHVIYAAVLVAGVTLVVALAGLSGSLAKRPAKELPTIGKRREAPGRPRTRGIAGEVRERDGLPVKGATVYVLPKKRAGANRDKVPHEVTDGAGRWAIGVRATKDAWVGVVAPGYRSAWLDGDALDVLQPLALVLERAPPLVVTVTDAAGQPIAEKGVQLEAWPPGATYFCPGPGCRRGEQWAVTDAEGKATFRLAVPGPVTLRAYVEGHHTRPPATWLADGQGEASLVAHRNASLTLQLDSAKPFREADGLVTAEFFHADTGAAAFAFTEMMQEEGLLSIHEALRPGTYHLKVSLAGWADHIEPLVSLPAASSDDAGRTLRVTLTGRRRPGTIVMTLEGNRGKRPSGGRIRAPLLWVLRDEAGWKELGWQLTGADEWDAARNRLALTLPPGTWRVMVADVLTGRTSVSEPLRVHSDQEKALTLLMPTGQTAEVPPVEAQGVYVRDLTVATPAGTRLPVFGSTLDGRLRFGGAIELLARRLTGSRVIVGPYPADELVLTVTRSDGSSERVHVR